MNTAILTDTFGLQGRTILITGAGSGLGQRAASTLAAAGAHVALLGRRREPLDATAESIRQAGGNAEVFVTDVSDEAAIETTLDAVAAHLPPMWALVNNAGVGGRFALTDATAQRVNAILSVNTVGALLMATAFARRLMARGAPGRIVNLCSLAAEKHSVGLGVYGASKAALEYLTRSMALEWAAKGINVNALNPGFIETDMNRAMFQTPAGQKMVEALPRQRLGVPAALDGPLLLLCSPAADSVTGATLTVDDAQRFAAV